MRVSIVTAYYNRKNLLINTLKTLEKSSFKDFEFIIVDDGSNEEHRIEDLLTTYNFLKIIRLEKKDKWYVNPCIPFNIGFKQCSGDLIIIQNPECLHVGDVLSYVDKNLTDENYLTFSCYSADKVTTDNFKTYNLSLEEITKNVVFKNSSVRKDGDSGWYNHPTFRPVALHFTNAITKKNLEKLNGFDERYALGIGYDDNEFLRRVQNLGLNIGYVTNPFVIHQNHYEESNNYTIPNAGELVQRNRKLFINN